MRARRIGYNEQAYTTVELFEASTRSHGRFLSDYLDGSRYFRIRYEDQNLRRTHVQFKLPQDMEAQFERMLAIVRKYA